MAATKKEPKKYESILRRLRLQQCRHQGTWCRLHDITSATLSGVERGGYRPGPVLRARIAAALGVAESEIFDPRGWALEYCPPAKTQRSKTC